MQYLGHTEGDARYEKHHDTYITEADIQELGIKSQNILTSNYYN